MKTVGGTDYANYAPQKCCGQTDGQTDGRTDRRTDERTDGRSGPTTRPAFAKATQVKNVARKRIHYLYEGWIESMSLGITVCHHSASLVMPNSDPGDGFF